MSTFAPTPVSGAVLSISSHGPLVVTCTAGTEDHACQHWNGERLYPTSAVTHLLLQLDAAGASTTPPTPVAGAVLATSKHGQQVVTCPPGVENEHCKLLKAERLFLASTVHALQQLLTAANPTSQQDPSDLFNLTPVRGVVVETAGQLGAVLVKRGEEDEYCRDSQAERVFVASSVKALQEALTASRANELRLQAELDALRGQRSGA